jgi:hypothetical protein
MILACLARILGLAAATSDGRSRRIAHPGVERLGSSVKQMRSHAIVCLGTSRSGSYAPWIDV